MVLLNVPAGLFCPAGHDLSGNARRGLGFPGKSR